MIYLIIVIILITTADLIWKKIQGESWLDKAQEKQQTRFKYMNQAILEEPDENMVWDAEKNRWIDMTQIKRMERYKEYRRSQGKGPTYEEWKAAREAERKSDAESSN